MINSVHLQDHDAPPTGVRYGDECYAVERDARRDIVFVERVSPPGPRVIIPLKALAESTSLPTIYQKLSEDKNGTR